MKQGYKIVSKGILIHAPIFSPGDVATTRVTFVAIEAALSFLFWAMSSQKELHSCRDLCPWSRDLLEWDGLCSHNPLIEAVPGNFDLSREQLEEMAAVTKEKARVRLGQLYQDLKLNNPVKLREQQRVATIKHKGSRKEKEEQIKASRKFYCLLAMLLDVTKPI